MCATIKNVMCTFLLSYNENLNIKNTLTEKNRQTFIVGGNMNKKR